MTNRLAQQSSPYLQQHAENPVDWHPWDTQALELAKAEDKPILLSIGYSTCHWCHVMAHESFEDPATAKVMNTHFVNIKVDREERPDLDKIYQTALTLLTQQGGGWPLTMILDPQTLVPVYGGTYFPKQPKYQLPGFADVLMRVNEVFHTQRDELSEQGGKIRDALDQLTPPLLDAELEDTALLDYTREQLERQYDPQDGGFGKAPKFPMPHAIQRLLRHWTYTRRSGGRDRTALDMVMITLTQMARGGIYDHLGGGFCRYSTDRKWMIPHFEKMLYDNAQLLSLYSYALTFGEDQLFEDAVTETIAWLQREMRDSAGGFYAAIDADSEGAEGKFYVWRREQVKKELTSEEYLIVETLYGLDKPANFENKWNFHRHDSWRSVIERLSLDADAANAHLKSAKQKLFQVRSLRPRPGTDHKILTAWNGLLVRGLVDAARQFRRDDWLQLALDAVDCLRANNFDGQRLYASTVMGAAVDTRPAAYLDDYANLLEGLLALLSLKWRAQDIELALELADILLDQFEDPDNGGFYFTAHDHEHLIHRPKPTMDDALPPGNGTVANVLLKLGHLMGEVRYIEAAERTLAWARGIMERVPAGHCTLLTALEGQVHAPQQIVLRGPADAMHEWTAQLPRDYAPWREVYAIPYERPGVVPSYLPKLVDAKTQATVTGFVCTGLSCSLPITDVEDLKRAL